MTDTDFHNLFIKYCPIIYFHKNDPYFQSDFDDILNISKITKTISNKIYDGIELKKPEVFNDVNNNTLIIIDNKQKNIPEEKIGKQILCRTSGIWTVETSNNNQQYYTQYLDLVYTVTFTWNGTLEPHAFDKEEIFIRLIRNSDREMNGLPINTWIPYRVFGSAHGYGKWYNFNDLDKEQNRCVMYSALESHAMYSDILVHKRIMGFGNDVTRKDVRWDPSQFVVFNTNMDKVTIYNKNGTKLLDGNDTKYFLYNGTIGDEKNNQLWPGSIYLTNSYDANNLDGWFKFGGGLTDLFDGKNPEVKPHIRYIIRIITVLILASLFGFILYNVATTHKYNNKKIILYGLLYVFLFILMYISSVYTGLELFVLNN